MTVKEARVREKKERQHVAEERCWNASDLSASKTSKRSVGVLLPACVKGGKYFTGH